HLVEAAGNDLGDLLVLGHAHHGQEVVSAGDGVDLADAVDRGDRLGDLRDAVHFGVDVNDSRDHVAYCIESGQRTPFSVAEAVAALEGAVDAGLVVGRAPGGQAPLALDLSLPLPLRPHPGQYVSMLHGYSL